MTELSIIIVNFNSTAYLRKCLTSLRNTALTGQLEIIVVDNASTRDDPGQLVAEFPGIRLIRSAANMGFARANNLGYSCSRGAYLLFLNPDTEVLGNAIDTMLACLRSLPEAGIAGCRLLNADGSVQSSCVQRFPTILNQAWNIEYLRQHWPSLSFWGIAPLYTHPSHPVPVQVISGACLMIKRELFEKVGKFCEEYFMYGEDVDLCYQVSALGSTAYYIPDASVVHFGGASTKVAAGNPWAEIMQRRAKLLFCRRTKGAVYAWSYRVAIGLAAALRLGIYPLLKCFPEGPLRNGIIRSTPERWIAVLKWSMGLDRGIGAHK